MKQAGRRKTGAAGGLVARLAGAAAALAVPLLPKCPLCLLPLAAAAGVALPPQPLLDGLVAASLAVWLATVLSTARWLPIRVAAAAAVVALLAGRWLGFSWASAAGAAGVLAVVIWTRLRPRACQRASGLPASSSEVSRAALP